MKIGFIGFGNMNQAIISGLMSYDYEIFVYNRTVSKLSSTEGYQVCETIEELINRSEIIFLGVKPHLYQELLAGYDYQDKCVISIGAGITSSLMNRYVTNFILTMPNTGVKINQGITAIVESDNPYFKVCIEIFEVLGRVVLTKEEHLPEYIALLGSSPAYFYQFVESLAKNFNNPMSEKFLAQIMISTGQMILSSDLNAGELKDNVCSKGGCTIEAVNVFESANLDKVTGDAISGVIKRAREMEIK